MTDKSMLSRRLQELTAPSGQEEILDVSYPAPRWKINKFQAGAVAVVAVVAGIILWEPSPPPPVPESVPEEIVVSVVGDVANPGLVTLAPGARVADALEQAHPVPEADLAAVNLAQLLADGQQITVSTYSAADPAESDGRVNLNSASAQELTALSGVGEVTAQAIVSFREQQGTFTSVEQLLEVSGIGPAKFAQLKDHVRI
ncbi:MAG: ComEA family DNA-binding protein [Corynebacterium sp.]|nr:ComEA family DNA-binding protein [Corynebacterium sp.]